MVEIGNVNILGSVYAITKKDYEEDPYFEKHMADGYCSFNTHQIVVCDMKTFDEWAEESDEAIANQLKATLRHEIVHAYLFESGLAANTDNTQAGWALHEEMVDWIALQGVKIYNTWKEVGAV